MEIIIDKKHNGMLLREYLRSDVGLSRAMLVKLKKDEQGILLNGKRVTVRAVLSEGDVLSLATEDTPEDENPYLEAVDIPLDILYEDNEIVVVNKPFDMVTHTTHGHYGDSLANALLAKYKGQGRAFVFRAINRLDKDTSGVVLVSKDRLSAFKLSTALKAGEIDKVYIAVVHGFLDGEGEINRHICRCGDSIITRRVCSENEAGADHALTVYRSIFSSDEYSVVMATPITGRTHQLRVHFSSLGHPIVGDSLYGGSTDKITRQALHAVSLEFPLPSSAERIATVAPIPPDMAALCKEHGFDTSGIVSCLSTLKRHLNTNY